VPEPEAEAGLGPTDEHGGSRLSAGLLDPGLIARLQDVHGPEVGAWIDSLPSLVADLAGRWDLTGVTRLVSGYAGYSVVLEGRSSQYGLVVVKLAPPEDEAQDREAVALTAWQGRGAVRVLGHDLADGALILQRLAPGRPLDPASQGDDSTTRALIAVAARLAVVPTPEVAALLPGLDTWASDLHTYAATYGAFGPVSQGLVDAARSRLDRLLATTEESVVLHGDLHHDNVQRDGDSWVAIDPHGYVGDPASEPAQMLFNPMPYVRPLSASALAALAERRLSAWAAESGLDPGRVRDWAVVKCVVSDVWSAEDHGGIDGLPTRVAAALLAGERG
jgi:streptomycin 6-kinase